MPPGVRTLFAALALCGCGGRAGKVIHDEIEPGPHLPPPSGFTLACVYVPPANEEDPPPPPAVVALCRATEPQQIRVSRVAGGMRVRLQFSDVPGRFLEVYVYQVGPSYERGAWVVARRRGAEPETFRPQSGWVAVHHFNRREKAIAVRYSLRYPGLVVNGAFREGDVPLPAHVPAPRRPDPWGMSDAGPSPR